MLTLPELLPLVLPGPALEVVVLEVVVPGPVFERLMAPLHNALLPELYPPLLTRPLELPVALEELYLEGLLPP